MAKIAGSEAGSETPWKWIGSGLEEFFDFFAFSAVMT
jgi:hypothetical protein